jgi:hypothetical protein
MTSLLHVQRTIPAECMSPCPTIAFLKYPGFEPFVDQAQDAAVGVAMLDESDHPSLVEIMEEALDIRVEHIIHFLLHQCP